MDGIDLLHIKKYKHIFDFGVIMGVPNKVMLRGIISEKWASETILFPETDIPEILYCDIEGSICSPVEFIFCDLSDRNSVMSNVSSYTNKNWQFKQALVSEERIIQFETDGGVVLQTDFKGISDTGVCIFECRHNGVAVYKARVDVGITDYVGTMKYATGYVINYLETLTDNREVV